jgi:hypothetical protein
MAYDDFAATDLTDDLTDDEEWLDDGDPLVDPDVDPEDAASLRRGLRILAEEQAHARFRSAASAAQRLAEDLAQDLVDSLPIGDAPAGANLRARIGAFLRRPDIARLPDAERRHLLELIRAIISHSKARDDALPAEPAGPSTLPSTLLRFVDLLSRRVYQLPFNEVSPAQRVKLLDAAATVGAYQPRPAPAPNE